MIVRLLSYNIKYGGRGRAAAIAEVIRNSGPDVVLLQEATDPRVIETLSKETELPHWGSRPAYSMGFLTRIPVTHHAWHQPGNARHAFLELVLEGVDCRIFGLHLVAWFSKWTERKRAREIRALLEGIREHQHGFHVIAGDFNALAPGELLQVERMPRWIRAMIWLSGRDISRETIQLLMDEGYADAWRRLHPKDNGYTFPTWDPHVRLDYVFVPERDANRVAVCEVVWTPPEPVRQASDHAPILIEVR
ncbi:MAG TPA: endonuclease/exonuclease/phosphatase family protein [Gemmatimonadaceae bacterium]|nr:endonuclease/exonuclease/phosphatase family protein [Gemmatimonadaceae bacterium]